ncbi:translation initiation factor IF-2, partial [Actinotignum timonense]|nr:translation initiation factor IF-2 [Actinotignum timonense]
PKPGAPVPSGKSGEAASAQGSAASHGGAKPQETGHAGRSNIPTPRGAVKSAKAARAEADQRTPRPGNNPYATSQGMPRPGGGRGPRPGNNPYATSQGMPRPGGGRKNAGTPRPGAHQG